MGMDYIPVYEDEQQAKPAERKILYYRNPMGLPDTSPVPKKDSMGMDYIAVYEEEAADDPAAIMVSLDKIQKAGVRTEKAEKRLLSEPLQVFGAIQLDERRERSVTLRAEAFIETVYAGATGQRVKAGEPLFRFYSPQVTQAIVDYRLAAGGGKKDVGARKLRNLGLSENFIKTLPMTGEVPLSLDWPSPVDGVVMSKNVVTGGRAMPGDELYRLSDISVVWVIAEVPESDIGRIALGAPASITIRAYPGEVFKGKVAFVLPQLKAETRTAQVRIELPNPDFRLLHLMYADITIETGQQEPVLAIPTSAVIDSGKRQVAILEQGGGRFKPVAIKLGRIGNGYVEIREGLKAGDSIVTRANFLLDAESNLKAALATLTSGEGAAP
jgi:Cu(I)/Ag(I) efflux system membrane fusion protein